MSDASQEDIIQVEEYGITWTLIKLQFVKLVNFVCIILGW